MTTTVTMMVVLLPSSDSMRPGYSVSALALMEAMVSFASVEFPAVGLDAASQNVSKMPKPPPLHEQGSFAEVQKKGEGSVENAQNANWSATRLLIT